MIHFKKLKATFATASIPMTECTIDNEICLCQLQGNNSIIRLHCTETTLSENFLANLIKIKDNYLFSQMFELNIKNKFITNISNSNVKELFTLNLRILFINECKLKTFDRNTFKTMLNLNKLSLARNEIDSISGMAFNYFSQSNIFELYLSENKLNKIQCGQFNDMSKLRLLYIDHNYVASIEVGSFDNLKNLIELNLHANRLNKIEHGYFNALSNLQVLFVDNNLIESIEVNSFDSMFKLKRLHLHSNKIKEIQNKNLYERKELETLYLYQNNIETIETIPFYTLYSLKKLYLSSNKIKSVKFVNFIDLQKLEELKLNKNEIGSLEINTFIVLENLCALDLSANKIAKLVSGVFNGLLNVKRLDLHLNDINYIESNALAHLLSLTSLNLDSNRILTLKSIQFNSNLIELSCRFNMLSNLSEINATSLKQLDISFNRIQTIRLVTHLSRLEHLDLSQNRLVKIEVNAFSKLANNLEHLNLSGNKLDLKNGESLFSSQSRLEFIDLSFNDIKYIDSNSTFQHMSSLKALNMSYNKLSYLDSFIFGYLSQLSDLNLASNNLKNLSKDCFFTLNHLKVLKLGFNQLEYVDFYVNNNSLEIFDLEHNKIALIKANDFEFKLNLTLLNLNSNPITEIHAKAFVNLRALKTLKISNTSVNLLPVTKTLVQLDLSNLFNLSLSSDDYLSRQIEWINVANASIRNVSFHRFLSNRTVYVDFSFNSVTRDDLKMLDSSLQTLILRRCNLHELSQINFDKLFNLKHLDVSSNNLTFLSLTLFERTKNLEHLDLSSNGLNEFGVVLPRGLKHLNLENNQLTTVSDVFYDYFSIETLKLGNNRLSVYPSFEISLNLNSIDTFKEIHLGQNHINKIKYFSYIFGQLNSTTFESNNISYIENDAFLNCRSLQYLSLAHNRLTKITVNNFHYLFSLVHLNLSFNDIIFIENNSFENLNKLTTLDLNFNNLISIENEMLVGLHSLNTLHLIGRNEIRVLNGSFKHLPNVSSLFLNESFIKRYKCLFMHNLQRDMQRNVGNKYVFYKSLNLLSTENPSSSSLDRAKCVLIFHLFQFRIHYNLRTDFSFEAFFSSCQNVLISNENTYDHNYGKCFVNFKSKTRNDESEPIEVVHSILRILSNVYYIIVMSLILSLLVPAFFMIFKYDLFSNQE
jgi:Leucine-rich repeat (LRR) protein